MNGEETKLVQEDKTIVKEEIFLDIPVIKDIADSPLIDSTELDSLHELMKLIHKSISVADFETLGENEKESITLSVDNILINKISSIKYSIEHNYCAPVQAKNLFWQIDGMLKFFSNPSFSSILKNKKLTFREFLGNFCKLKDEIITHLENYFSLEELDSRSNNILHKLKEYKKLLEDTPRSKDLKEEDLKEIDTYLKSVKKMYYNDDPSINEAIKDVYAPLSYKFIEILQATHLRKLNKYTHDLQFRHVEIPLPPDDPEFSKGSECELDKIKKYLLDIQDKINSDSEEITTDIKNAVYLLEKALENYEGPVRTVLSMPSGWIPCTEENSRKNKEIFDNGQIEEIKLPPGNKSFSDTQKTASPDDNLVRPDDIQPEGFAAKVSFYQAAAIRGVKLTGLIVIAAPVAVVYGASVLIVSSAVQMAKAMLWNGAVTAITGVLQLGFGVLWAALNAVRLRTKTDLAQHGVKNIYAGLINITGILKLNRDHMQTDSSGHRFPNPNPWWKPQLNTDISLIKEIKMAVKRDYSLFPDYQNKSQSRNFVISIADRIGKEAKIIRDSLPTFRGKKKVD